MTGRSRGSKEWIHDGSDWPQKCLAEATTVFSTVQGQGAIPKLKTFYEEENKTKPKTTSEKGQGKQRTGESQAADLRRITKSPRWSWPK